jgi:hypothetical protein
MASPAGDLRIGLGRGMGIGWLLCATKGTFASFSPKSAVGPNRPTNSRVWSSEVRPLPVQSKHGNQTVGS